MRFLALRMELDIPGFASRTRGARGCTRERERRKIELILFSAFPSHAANLRVARQKAENPSIFCIRPWLDSGRVRVSFQPNRSGDTGSCEWLQKA